MVSLRKPNPWRISIVFAYTLRTPDKIIGMICGCRIAHFFENIEFQLHKHFDIIAYSRFHQSRMSGPYYRTRILLEQFAFRCTYIAEYVENIEFSLLFDKGSIHIGHGYHVRCMHFCIPKIRGIESYPLFEHRLISK